MKEKDERSYLMKKEEELEQRAYSFSHEEDLYSNTSSDHLPQKDGQKLELRLIRVLEISS